MYHKLRNSRKVKSVGVVIIVAAIVIYGLIHVEQRAAANKGLESAQPRSGSANYGIAAGGGLTSDSPTVLNQRLTTMQNLGVGWVRFDFSWATIQSKNAKSYNWAATDRVVKAATAHHLKVLGTIVDAPTWARATGCTDLHCQPASPAAFGKFSGTVAARYSPVGIHDWEIWNEENSVNFWLPAPSASAYTQLLKASSTAIRKADKSSFVLVGGLAHTGPDSHDIAPTKFTASLYADGAKTYFDGVASHPYTYPKLPSASDRSGPFAIRKVMVAHGDSAKPIWITEIGAPTNGPDKSHVTDAVQAQTVATAARLYNQSWLGPLFWYSDTDAGTSPTTNENFFGLVQANGSHKPAYGTLQALIAENKY